jgi:hypothetical protein
MASNVVSGRAPASGKTFFLFSYMHSKSDTGPQVQSLSSRRCRRRGDAKRPFKLNPSLPSRASARNPAYCMRLECWTTRPRDTRDTSGVFDTSQKRVAAAVHGKYLAVASRGSWSRGSMGRHQIFSPHGRKYLSPAPPSALWRGRTLRDGPTYGWPRSRRTSPSSWEGRNARSRGGQPPCFSSSASSSCRANAEHSHSRAERAPRGGRKKKKKKGDPIPAQIGEKRERNERRSCVG